MCIIAYVPSGAKLEEETIKTMFENNSHGAGVMWKPHDNSQIEIRKGFMNVESLLKVWHTIPERCDRAIHCRIATSGKISTGCCHPFPVRAKTTAMRKASDRTNVALMHNGIISFCTPKKGMKADYSDSMLFASQILFPLRKQLGMEAVQTLLDNCCDSRLLIFRSDGDAIMSGSWHFDNGVYYSNMSYRPYSFNYSYKNVTTKYLSDYYGLVGDSDDDDINVPPYHPGYSHKEIIYLDISQSKEDTEDIKDKVWDELELVHGVQYVDAYPDSEDLKLRKTLLVEIDGWLPRDLDGIADYYLVKP